MGIFCFNFYKKLWTKLAADSCYFKNPKHNSQTSPTTTITTLVAMASVVGSSSKIHMARGAGRAVWTVRT
jgi:hypothetical protein